MSDFYHRRFHILVCTTIIESGIDVPSANTIIIDRADRLGLAQLHQLRGRVGRSHHQAYAYLLVPHEQAMTKDAKKRLEALALSKDLGVGFTLATHDMEIRGAGEFLGDEQSGQMQAIGFDLYMEMLERAINTLKAGKTIHFDQPLLETTEIDLQMPAIIPENYMPNVHSRLVLYKRIASCKDERALNDLRIEMIDRFGLLLEPIENLFEITALKRAAEKLGIQKIAGNDKQIVITFTNHPAIDLNKMIQLIQHHPKQYRMQNECAIKYLVDTPTTYERIQTVKQFIGQLQG